MCDAGDLVDAAGAVLTGGGTLAYKAVTGDDVIAAKVIKGALGVGKPGAPAKLPDIAPPPPPVDPTDLIIQRAMSAERMRQMNTGMGASFLTGPGGLKDLAPVKLPAAGGY